MFLLYIWLVGRLCQLVYNINFLQRYKKAGLFIQELLTTCNKHCILLQCASLISGQQD